MNTKNESKIESKNESKNESRIESENECKIDNLKQNQATSQLKVVVKDAYKVENKKLNKLQNKVQNKNLNKEQNKVKLEDEIPLIDDGIEEIAIERSDHLTNSSSNNEDTLIQTRSTDAMHNEQSNQNINQDNQTGHSSTGDQVKQTNLPIYSSNADQQASVGGQNRCQLQMMNNFEKIQLNEDVSSDRCIVNDEDTQATDLCQFDSVDLNPDEQEEKERLIEQLLELRNTLDDLSNRVGSVREMSFKLTNENNVLSQYVSNLMSASSVFVTTNAPTVKRRQRK